MKLQVGAIIATRNPPSCFSMPCFAVLITPSVNRPDFSSDCTVSVSSISSFEINIVNLFPALAAPCSLMFLLNLSNKEEIHLVDHLCKTSLTKGIEKSINGFVPELPILLPNILPINPAD